MSSTTEVALRKMTIAQLKQKLKQKNLKVTGKKEELVQRILEHEKNNKEEDDDDDGDDDEDDDNEHKDSGSSGKDFFYPLEKIATAPQEISVIPQEKIFTSSKGEKSGKEQKKKTKKRARSDYESEEEDGKGGDGASLKKNELVQTNYTPLVDTLEEGWKQLLAPEFQKSYFKEVEKFVAKERQTSSVYPPHEEVFNAFNTTPLDQVKVVILGQDPYYNPGQAHGLCFSVRRGVNVPPSLHRIYKVLENGFPGFKRPKHGCLLEWAQRGVLMLNATLTVREGKPNSHSNCGWQTFTDEVIKKINEHKQGIIFFLWGSFARGKAKLIDKEKHHVLECGHPSPMGGSDFNSCDHFLKANQILQNKGIDAIDWLLSP